MGGTVDPKTGKVVWKANVPIEDQPAYYNSHPPRALAGLICTPIDPPKPPSFHFDGHGEPVNVVFAIACRCGCKLFTVLAYIDDEDIQSPISVECSMCDWSQEIFSSGEHGYDAEVREEPLEQDEKDDDLIDELEAPEIPNPHEVIVRFEYPSDHLGDPQWKDREQELFSWITIIARDPESGELAFLFDEECA